MVGGNATALLGARVITALGNLGLAALVAARTGSAGFGTFAALLAAGAVANLFITFGVDLVVVRAVADARPDAASTVRQAALLQMLGATAFTCIAGVAVVAGASPLILLPAVALYPMGITTVAGAVLRGAQQMWPIPVASFAAAATALAVAWLVLSDDMAVAVAAVLVGHIVSASVLVTQAVRVGLHPVSNDRDNDDSDRQEREAGQLRQLLSESWVFAVATVATTVMIQGGLIVYETVAQGDSGGLAAGIRLAETARLVPAAAFAALFPAMFDGVHRSPRYRQLFHALVGYAVAAAAALIVLAPVLAEQIFDDPPDGAVTIRILAVGLVATVFRLRHSFELIALGRERTVLAVAAAGAVVAMVGYVVGAAMDSVIVVAAVQLGAAVATAAALAGANHQAAVTAPAGTG